MLSNEQIRSFRENGFLPVGKVLDDEQVESLRAALAAVMEGQSAARPERITNMTGNPDQVVVQVVNIWAADPRFRAHAANPTLCAMAAQLMATDVVRVWHDQIQYKPARSGGPTNWHQDHPYWPILQPADLVSAWVALDDATIENGCMRMVPRSHRWGPHKGGTIGTRADFSPDYDPALVPADESIEIVPCEVPKGHAMFHHCLTWHGSPPNPSPRPRRAIAVHYMPGHTRYVPTGSHIMEHHVAVGPGEILIGPAFPTVWERGPVPEA
jgi:ectoine hydroxylase-related dioxygenase (phytanoyl-CoA dioxygenase family)